MPECHKPIQKFKYVKALSKPRHKVFFFSLSNGKVCFFGSQIWGNIIHHDHVGQKWKNLPHPLKVVLWLTKCKKIINFTHMACWKLSYELPGSEHSLNSSKMIKQNLWNGHTSAKYGHRKCPGTPNLKYQSARRGGKIIARSKMSEFSINVAKIYNSQYISLLYRILNKSCHI